VKTALFPDPDGKYYFKKINNTDTSLHEGIILTQNSSHFGEIVLFTKPQSEPHILTLMGPSSNNSSLTLMMIVSMGCDYVSELRPQTGLLFIPK
jgi:hypothetical protein